MENCLRIHNIHDLEKAVGGDNVFLGKLFADYFSQMVSKAGQLDQINGGGAKDNGHSFPDSIMGTMTLKGILAKWTNLVLDTIFTSLYKYHFTELNPDVGDIGKIMDLFSATNAAICTMEPLLMDMTSNDIKNFDDLINAAFGKNSDETYMYRHFKVLYEHSEQWKKETMWTDCADDSRLKDIIKSKTSL